MLNRPLSKKIYEELCEVIPGGVNSPVRAFKGMSLMPMVADYGIEDQVIDVDGNSYIDYCCSWGALIHGHAHHSILESVQKRMNKGTSFGITTPIEGMLAKKIIEHVPSIEKLRFVSSGTEATMSAARLARGYTGKDIIIKFSGNYHGHADFFLIQAGSGVMGLSQSSSEGIPNESVKQTISLPYNDVNAFRTLVQNEEFRERIAAVIVEPISGNMGVVPASPEFLNVLREETKKIGSILILDEVITGFRVGLGGAQSLYNIKPDLSCFGKIIGGGFPAAAFGGRQEIMDLLAPIGSVYQAGTLSGNPVAMEAGYQALLLLEKKGFYKDLEERTNILIAPVREAISKMNLPACIQQVGSMFTIFFGKKEICNLEDARNLNHEQYARFFRYLFENGVYFPPLQQEACFVSTAHTKAHLEKTRDLILHFLRNIKDVAL